MSPFAAASKLRSADDAAALIFDGATVAVSGNGGGMLEADTILAAVEKAPAHPAWQQLTEEERGQISAVSEELRVLRDGDDRTLIQQATAALDQATRRFAELMMDTAVTTALGGQTMTAAGEKLGDGPAAPHPFAKAEFQNETQD